ncbi:hypothetical protein C8Q70DRAFT_1050494 [Cubamyces menziesii]|nr:hypothetical protein C8Q70DRAFT_1050494 [Cubamyces menziesii]
MTTVPPRPTSSPRWDSRNEGFVSPARLQQWKQENERTHTFTSPPSQTQQDSGPQQATNAERPAHGRRLTDSYPTPPPTSPNKAQHRSKPSFSAFFSRKSSQLDDALPLPPPARPPAQQQTSEANVPQGNPSRPSGPQRAPSRDESNAVTSPRVLQKEPPLVRSQTAQVAPAQVPPLHPEIRSIVTLTLAHAHKIYFSGPLIRRFERQTDGQTPAKDEGWREVWAQLGGTTLSVWDMEEIREASKQGKQVPPSYINVTDAFVQQVGSVTIPPPNPGVPPRRYPNVLSLNTAGSNLYLFSCPSETAMAQWIAAFRLSAWEKSRLEEIYTAHLIRITLNDGRTTPSPLTNGRLEGWVRIRIAGQTDWKRQWMVITTGAHPGHPDHGSISSIAQERSESPSAPRKKRMSNLFSRDKSPTRTHLPAQPMIQLFASSRPRDKKKALLTMHSVTQAFAVYPERPELISRSTLMKLEGRLGNEEMAGSLSMCEAWLLVMPELEGQNTRASEMLRWIIAIHDAFELYGRPRMYSWDPRDPKSMMFAYPIGPNRDLLFLDREFADTLPINEKSTSAVRSQLQRILLDRMNGVGPEAGGPPADNGPPTLPPLPSVTADEPEQPTPRQPASNGGVSSLQLPPLSFDSTPIHEEQAPQRVDADHRPLTPITERSVPLEAASRSLSGEKPQEARAQLSNSPPQAPIPEEQPSTSILNQPFVTSPSATSPPAEYTSPRRSEDSFAPGTSSRPDSKLSYRAGGQIASVPSRSSSSHPASPTFGERIQPPTSPEIRPSTPSTPPRFQSPRALSPPRLASPPQPQSQTPVSPTPETPNSVRIVPPRSISQSSIPTSLYTLPTPTSRTGQSMMDHAKDKPAPPLPISASSSQSPPAVPRKNSTETDDILGDAGAALFYMQHMQQQEGTGTGVRSRPPRLRGPPPKASPSEDEDETPSESDSEPYTPPPRAMASPLRVRQTSPPPGEQPPPVVPAKSPRPSANQPVSTQSEAPTATAAASRPSALRNKPSGARAAPSSSSTRVSAYLQNSLPPPDEAPSEKTTTPATTANQTDKSDDDRDAMAAAVQKPAPAHDHGFEDPTADALAALSFLEREERPAPPPAAPQSPSQRSFTATPRSPPLPEVVETPASPSQTRPAPSEPRSSFAPTRLAAERKAKTQAQQAAHQAAAHRPGKANGRKGGKPRDSGAWGESSEEEEEEEEEEDDDVDSDDEPAPRTRTTSVSDQASALGHGAPPSIAGRSPYPQTNTSSPARSQVDVNNNPGAYPAQRRGRDLPQVPGQRLPEQEDYLGAQPQPRRFVSDSFTDGGRRSMYPESLSRQASPSFGQSSMRPASQYPSASQVGPGLQPPSRPIWSQVLDPDRNVDPSANNGRDTFIQIEAPATTMTKAFTPHGLLSAGLQDKQDRSAKRQEELARETGASLINVPNKPPPPQTGLLGAVTAHERERKREGGLGAALTEREREKRMAEERQRKLDEYQRQQLDQMQQGGSMYGGMGMGPMGFNPMMANPMMMGMNPMMTGGWGFPGMMPGFANPQQMFAAQQAAAQAYQQAMVAFSTAGSQIGGGADGGANQGPLNPMMTGASMGMGGFDPRMSMMGMPMMNTGMSGMGMGMGMTPGMGGMNPGMNPNMGMGGMGGMGGMQGMGGMGLNPMMTGGGMGMQMTGGGSQFDTRFSPGAEGAPRQPGDSTGPGSRAVSSHPSSPGPQGSPAGPRPVDSAESSQQNVSGPSSSNAQ